MRHSKLNEGMWANDLVDLVQPLVSIDEYNSKIDETAIVIGFFVQDKDAADDLNRFIQKSPVAFVDCEVSPAPDQRGYYVVFVELPYNDRLVTNIGSLLREISPLVGVENWQVKCRNLEGLVQFDGDRLALVLKANYLSDQIKLLRKKMKSLRVIREKKAEEKARAAEEKERAAKEKERKAREDAREMERKRVEKSKEKQKAVSSEKSTTKAAKEQ